MKKILNALKFEYILKIQYHNHTWHSFLSFHLIDKYKSFNKYYLENCVSSSALKNQQMPKFQQKLG